MSHRIHINSFLAAAVLGCLLKFDAAALAEPAPPCDDTPPNPAHVSAGPTPAVKVWHASDFEKQWQPAACLHWQPMDTAIVVAAAGRFHEAGGAEAILSRFADISRLTTMRYWSVTRKFWRPLVTDADALSGPDRALRRDDFSLRELTAGKRFHYWQTENSPANDVVYRVDVRARTGDRLTLAFENATPVSILLFPLFDVGEYQFVYFLEREEGDLWRYYSLLRTADSVGVSGKDHEASFINRAVAVFRYVAGIAGDSAPPAAP